MNRTDYYGNGGDPYEAGDEQYEECEVCHQEFTGTCPINSADCPYASVTDDEEDEGPDFEDVENLKALLDDDEEVEQLIDDDEPLPPDDLVDDDEPPSTSPETPVSRPTARGNKTAAPSTRRGRRSGKT